MVTSYRVLKGKRAVGPEYDVDKAAFEIAAALSVLGLDGMMIVLGSAPDDDDADFVHTEIAAATVKKIWAVLKPIDEKKFRAALKKSAIGKDADRDTREYVETNFAELKKAYAAAAKDKARLQVLAG